jgi:hypothetical protein
LKGHDRICFAQELFSEQPSAPPSSSALHIKPTELRSWSDEACYKPEEHHSVRKLAQLSPRTAGHRQLLFLEFQSQFYAIILARNAAPEVVLSHQIQEVCKRGGSSSNTACIISRSFMAETMRGRTESPTTSLTESSTTLPLHSWHTAAISPRLDRVQILLATALRLQTAKIPIQASSFRPAVWPKL